MLKATGGGGGMGMAVCLDAEELKLTYERTVEMTKVKYSLRMRRATADLTHAIATVLDPLRGLGFLHREVHPSRPAYRNPNIWRWKRQSTRLWRA